MEESITWVGIDAHKKTLAVAAFQRPGQEPEEFTIDNDERAIRKLVRRLERDGDGREIRICYEAGTSHASTPRWTLYERLSPRRRRGDRRRSCS